MVKGDSQGERSSKLTTFQKLQNLRNRKSKAQTAEKPKPLHNLLRDAAMKKPRDHFVEIQKQMTFNSIKIKDESNNAPSRDSNEANINISEIGGINVDSPMGPLNYINQPKNP